MSEDGMPWRNAELLKSKYHDESMTLHEIADELDCSHETVRGWMVKHDIPRRSTSEAESNGDVAKLHDPEWLETKYWGQDMSTVEIADELGVGHSTVRSWMKRHGIDRRGSPGDVEKLRDRDTLRRLYLEENRTASEVAEFCSVHRTTVMRWLKRHNIDTRGAGQRPGRDYDTISSEETLRKLYLDDERSINEIAERAGVSVWAVHSRLQNYGIETRDHGEPSSKIDMSRYYGANWEEQRLKALIRDGARCRRCGKTEAEQMREADRSLHIHHIVPRSEFVTDGKFDYKAANRSENLMTLCISCHGKIENIPADTRHLA